MQATRGRGDDTANGVASTCSKWIGGIDGLKDSIERFRYVQIDNLDFRKCIERYDSTETLFYLDPPYIKSTRYEKNVYQYEMSLEDHKDLVNILKNIKGKFILSGYDNNLYNKHFERIFIKSIPERSSKKRVLGHEYIWINYKQEKNEQISIWS